MAKKIQKHAYVIFDDTTSLQSEAYQKLQINLDYASIDEKYRVISCISPTKGEGKTTTLVNLANIYSLKGFRCIIIDLDLRAPQDHKFFNLVNDKGITDYLSNKASKEEVIHQVKEHLSIITSGSTTPFPSKVIESKKLKDLIEELKGEYDYIFIDTSPVLLFGDAVVISTFVDAFLLVVAMNITRKSELKEALKMVETSHINVVGTVLTHADNKAKKYKNSYGYGYRYNNVNN